jgi:RND superfamily putative drug exporter
MQMTSLTRWTLAHKRLVALLWVALTVGGILAAGPATDALKEDQSAPGKEAWQVNEEILAAYEGTGGDAAPLVPVVTLPEGTDISSSEVAKDLAAIDDDLEKALPGARIASYSSTGDDTFLSADGMTTYSIVHPPAPAEENFGANPEAEEAVSKALDGATVAGEPVQLTGFDALLAEAGEESEGPSVLLETLIGALGALAVLAFVFASTLAFVPLVMAFCSILTTFVLLLGLTEITTVSPVVQFLIALLGLGIAIDYSLIVVSRWREELAHGAEGDEAVIRAMQTSGRAVVFSGITVAIGLLALIAIPLPFLQSTGLGGMLIPLVSTLCAITLLPVVLSKWGARLDWPHRRTDDRASRAWTRWAEGVVKRRWLAAGVGLAMIGALAIAATQIHLGIPDASVVAPSGEANDALVTLDESGIGEGVLLPHEVLIDGKSDPDQVAEQLGAVEGVHGAVAPEDWRAEGTSLVEVIPVAGSGTDESGETLELVRTEADAAGSDVRVGGVPASDADFIDAVYGSFPMMLALIAITSFVLLARAFRSLLLPIKAIALNVLSLVATCGVLVLVWQLGIGSEAIWGVEATGSIPSWMPVMIFAFLFGLSMDYEVFILARMREAYDRTGSTDAAVIEGIGRTGRLVTSAALILFLAFVALAASPGTDIKMFATGLGAGILIDATIIRALIVPAAVSLMGRWNWWLPSRPARLLGVEPSLEGGRSK